MSESPQYAQPLTVAIIGTGFGGICAAIKLKEAGINNITMFEKADRLGGTWRDNTYPGAACDVPSHLYSFSFEKKHDWTRKFAEQAEILAYLHHCAQKYKLLPHIRFNTEIESATFDETEGVWVIHTNKGEQYKASILISACGQLNRPAYPKIKGLDSFAGTQFHSARWNHDYDLKGKNVAVIGTGASAIQFVPPVVKQAEKVFLFQRTPPWILKKPDRAYLSIEKTLFKYLPFYQLLHRAQIYWWNEVRFLAFRKNSIFNDIFSAVVKRNLENSIKDPVLKAKLTPDYPVGCKRILITNDYYQGISSSNVSVITEEIDSVTPEGVLTTDNNLYKVDTIIYGTGFQSTDFLAPMKITGRNGQDLNQTWQDGAEAYLGITISGFPNLFLLYGPNTNLAHNSIIYMLESQINYVMSCINILRKDNVKYIDLKKELMRTYNSSIQERIKDAVWTGGCNSWYMRADGKNTNNWPGFTFEYRFRTRNANIDDYEVIAN